MIYYMNKMIIQSLPLNKISNDVYNWLRKRRNISSLLLSKRKLKVIVIEEHNPIY